jgi:hypothetical protein
MYDVQEEKSGSARTRFKSHRGVAEEERAKVSHVTLGGLSAQGALSNSAGPQPAIRSVWPPTSSFRGQDDFSDLDTTTPANTVKMAPKKAAVRAPQENISLGPQVREGKTPRTRQLCDDTRSRQSTCDAEVVKTRISR